MSPAHLSEHQASESVWASSMKEPRPWGLERSPKVGREGIETANQATEQDKWSDYKKMSVNTQLADSMGYSLGILTKEM